MDLEEPVFQDRRDAGRQLAKELAAYRNRNDVVVLALPRGGVPVAFEVARELGAPLDVFCVRKLGAPGQAELAIGAIASGGVTVMNEDVLRMLRLTAQDVEAAAAYEAAELEQSEREYRGAAPGVEVAGRTAIVVDDGLATGATMRAAVKALWQRNAAKVVAAVPVGAPRSCQDLEELVNQLICLYRPEQFRAVGEWYHDFSQTTREEVSRLLRKGNRNFGRNVTQVLQ
ncbi:MAG TPA: phosphoribosyltransferase [Bryobacteraceae bacterium]|jgi:putative phosphoribosyl transferase|nr:phosphoribosyltransferase [Bryobacteraceae bacterium]